MIYTVSPIPQSSELSPAGTTLKELCDLIEKCPKLILRKRLFLKNAKLNCEETQGNSLAESINYVLITYDLHHC